MKQNPSKSTSSAANADPRSAQAAAKMINQENRKTGGKTLLFPWLAIASAKLATFCFVICVTLPATHAQISSRTSEIRDTNIYAAGGVPGRQIPIPKPTPKPIPTPTPPPKAPVDPQWNVNAGGSWTTASNWDTGVPVTGDIVVFSSATGGSGAKATTLEASFNISSLTFNSTQTGAVTIANGSGTNLLTLSPTSNGATTLTVDAASGNHTISANVQLAAQDSQVWSIGTGRTFTASDVISGDTATRGFTKTGGGILTLSGASPNTYTGTTTVSDGTLTLGKTGSTNAIAGDLIINNGGTVNYSGTAGNNNQIVDTSNVTVNSGGALSIGARSETFDLSQGSLTINGGTLSVGSGGLTIQQGSLILNGGTIDKTASSGTYTLTSNVTYQSSATAQATISSTGGANLSLGSNVVRNQVFNVTDSSTLASGLAELTVSAVISGGSNITVVKQGTGVVVFSVNNTYNGATTVSAGTLLINGNQSAATGAVAVNNAGTILGGIGNIGGKVTVAGGATAGSGSIILAGSGVNDANKFGTLTVSNTSAGAITLNSGSIIELALGNTSTTHSTLAHTGAGTISFASNQAFTFLDFGATTITYQDIITGTGLSTLDTSGWSITNPGWSGSFVLDASGNIDLNLTAIPEPSTWVAAALALGVVGYSQKRRLRQLLARS